MPVVAVDVHVLPSGDRHCSIPPFGSLASPSSSASSATTVSIVRPVSVESTCFQEFAPGPLSRKPGRPPASSLHITMPGPAAMTPLIRPRPCGCMKTNCDSQPTPATSNETGSIAVGVVADGPDVGGRLAVAWATELAGDGLLLAAQAATARLRETMHESVWRTEEPAILWP